tara:strand:- start:23563 stop:23964 length:402 start_codon:yes stop_codon:yes gene_type:complete
MDSPLAEFIKYKPEELDKYLEALQNDLRIRSNINNVLSKDVNTSDANTLAINNFIEKYDTTVNKQLNTLITLNNDIRKEVNLHKDLKDKSLQYKQYISSEKCLAMKNNLRQIKTLKQELEHFLEERGIQAPKI